MVVLLSSLLVTVKQRNGHDIVSTLAKANINLILFLVMTKFP